MRSRARAASPRDASSARSASASRARTGRSSASSASAASSRSLTGPASSAGGACARARASSAAASRSRRLSISSSSVVPAAAAASASARRARVSSSSSRRLLELNLHVVGRRCGLLPQQLGHRGGLGRLLGGHAHGPALGHGERQPLGHGQDRRLRRHGGHHLPLCEPRQMSCRLSGSAGSAMATSSRSPAKASANGGVAAGRGGPQQVRRHRVELVALQVHVQQARGARRWRGPAGPR